MKKAFLRQVASLFKEEDLQQYTFVFPNRRSSLFFLKYLGELAQRPLFSPKVITVDDLFSFLSDLENLPPLPLMLRLWKVWCQYHKEDLDEFISWGSVILADFNDVDQNLAPAKDLFANMSDLRNIEQDYSYLTPEQISAIKRLMGLRLNLEEKQTKKKYFDIWKFMLPVYNSFRQSLISENKSYRGLQYRTVAEGITGLKEGRPNPELEEKLKKLSKAVFIGFSAPTECEKVLMRYFSDKDGYGLFYWDFYSDMLTASHNRSSHLISRCVKEFKCSRPIKDGKGMVEKDSCKYTVVPAGGASAQSMIAADILKETLSSDSDPIDTAVVVSDDSLLLPLLSMLGDIPVNVTMGYPLRATSAASFISSLISLHLQSDLRNGKIYLSGNALRSLLDHAYVRAINENQAEAFSSIILKRNLIRVESSELLGNLEVEDTGLAGFLRLLVPHSEMFTSESGEYSSKLMKSIVSYQRNIIEYVSEYLSSRERSFLNVYHDILDSVYSSEVEFNRARTVYAVLRSGLRTATVSFRGEPLQGVQIMGPLETRSLDFDNVIFLSFNEGLFPSNGEQSSSIPYFLRKSFSLPTYEDMDSISAYNFYRLIQRASNVFMLYDSATVESYKAKEESRFVKQLIYDFGVRPQYRDYQFPVPSGAVSYENDIVASSADLEYLKNFFPSLSGGGEAKMSPSSLNMYLTCQRKFLLSKVLNIKEESELTEKVEAGNFGDLLHYCMEKIYLSYKKDGQKLEVDKVLMEEICKKASDKTFMDSLVKAAFKEEMNVNTIEGENLLIKESVEKYVKMTLKSDLHKAEISPFSILGLEHIIQMPLCGAYFRVYIDRLEECDGVMRICDYKSGVFLKVSGGDLQSSLKEKGFKINTARPYTPYKKMEDEEFSDLLEVIFKGDSNRDHYHEILFQLLLYALLTGESKGYDGDYELSVYQMRIIDKAGPVTVKVTHSQIDAFKKSLSGLVGEIKAKTEGATPAIFSVCTDTSHCKYCDFSKFCRRV